MERNVSILFANGRVYVFVIANTVEGVELNCQRIGKGERKSNSLVSMFFMFCRHY